MANDKAPSDKTASTPSHPPPPLDPFPTYSQPFPRSSSDDDNLFIQFRRFADESLKLFFSPFFSSSQHPPLDMERRMENRMKRSNELEEGIRKQIEQNFEEMRQAFHSQHRGSDADETTKCPALSTESFYQDWTIGTELGALHKQEPKRQPRWTTGNAAKCPALNDEMKESAKKCPAMFDEAGKPKTELDAYEQAGRASSNQEADSAFYGLSSGLGWDGEVKKSLEQSIAQTQQSQPDDIRPPDVPTTRTSTRLSSLWMNPFKNAHQTIPWLVLSPYSPVYLCNPEQASAMTIEYTESVDEPFRMKVIRYKERKQNELDVKMARALPWADAFEDLMSVAKMGEMVDRHVSTFKTPSTWIHDMVKRGSLGPAWGFNTHGQLAQKQLMPKGDGRILEEIFKDITRSLEKEVRQWPGNIFVPVPTENGISLVPEHILSAVGAQEKYMNDTRQGGLPTEIVEKIRAARNAEDWEAVRQAVLAMARNRDESVDVQKHLDDAAKDARNELRAAQAEAHRPLYSAIKALEAELPNQAWQARKQERLERVDRDNDEKDAATALHGSLPAGEAQTRTAPQQPNWSSSSTTWSSDDLTDQSPSVIVSTMTRTEIRTLPDGSSETTRVSNRKFADGHEEKEESVELTPARQTEMSTKPVVSDRQTQTAEPVQDTLKKMTKGGWFWH